MADLVDSSCFMYIFLYGYLILMGHATRQSNFLDRQGWINTEHLSRLSNPVHQESPQVAQNAHELTRVQNSFLMKTKAPFVQQANQIQYGPWPATPPYRGHGGQLHQGKRTRWQDTR